MKLAAKVIVFATLCLAATVVPAAAQSDRVGFTFMIDAGVGFQSDTALEESAVGLAGLNVGLGGWVTDNIALLGRISGTNVSYDFGAFGDVGQLSGVVAPTVQIWPSARGYLEAGVGLGFWNAEGETDQGLGLILGAGFSVFNRGKHNLIVGVEYAPAFTDSAVHNFGITFGYQLW